MKVGLTQNKDFLSGLMFMAIGAVGLYMALDYPMGSALRMGPGYFPNVLSSLLILAGIYCLIHGLLKSDQMKIKGNWSVRALIIIPLGTVVFGLLMEHTGFIPAIIALIFIVAYAGDEFKFLEVLFLAVGLTIACTALFIYGLGLPYPLWQGY
jgi:Tripartite tricarboxylate transporter TctB family